MSTRLMDLRKPGELAVLASRDTDSCTVCEHPSSPGKGGCWGSEGAAAGSGTVAPAGEATVFHDR